jgi:adenosylhomocysteine nucleosidase/adenosylhomocysteine/aminodeoxyfutalosine nucleosidase
MDGEIAEFLIALDGRTDESWNGFVFYKGLLEGKDVVVAKSGVGKTMSAMVTQHLIDVYRPSAIIFTGLAGGVSPGLDIGDTLIANDCMQHDFDVTALGPKRGAIPFTPYRIFSCDPGLLELAMSCVPLDGKAVRGRILTGDQFITGKNLSAMRYLVEELEGDAVEMEGASVGLVSTVNSIPFLLVRTISDKADAGATLDFKAFLPKASRNSLRFVRHILRGFTV